MNYLIYNTVFHFKDVVKCIFSNAKYPVGRRATGGKRNEIRDMILMQIDTVLGEIC